MQPSPAVDNANLSRILVANTRTLCMTTHNRGAISTDSALYWLERFRAIEIFLIGAAKYIWQIAFFLSI